MNPTHVLLSKIVLGFGLAVALAVASGCSRDSSSDGMKPMSADEHQKMQGK